MANGSTGPSGVPAWLQPIVQIVTTLGVPTVFAGILLWFVLTRLDTALGVIMANEETRTQKLIDIETGFASALDRQTLSFNATIQENIKAIDRQTAMFNAAIQENIKAIRDNAEINRQTAIATQRMLTEGKGASP